MRIPLEDGDSKASAKLDMEAELDNDAKDNCEQSAEQQQNKSDDTTERVEQCQNDDEQFDNKFSKEIPRHLVHFENVHEMEAHTQQRRGDA